MFWLISQSAHPALLNNSKAPLTLHNRIQILNNGEATFVEIKKALRAARSSIHLEYYIIEDDPLGREIADILIEKANEGVEVRLIYDDVGSWGLSRHYIGRLRKAGIQVYPFMKVVFPWLTSKVNYRNHRKILVVDGHIGFLGGCNIADRYFDGGEFPEWRDTHVRIEGMSVMSLQATFLLDRYFILNKNLGRRRKYYPYVDAKDKELLAAGTAGGNRYYAQILASGPDSDWAAIMQCYFTAITKARNHICIITPYFIPSETILNAIKITALSDVTVSLMIPERSDTWLTNWGTMSYISELIDAGVKVYLFKRGFNHSKVLSIDGEYCIIGSANMDNRSLEHHFEVTSVIYDPECARTVEDRFRKDLSRCTLVTKAKWNKRPLRNKFYESVARLVSPLL